MTLGGKKALGIPRLTGPVPSPEANQKYVKSGVWSVVCSMTMSGSASSKIACLADDAGDDPKATAHFNPISVAFLICAVPVFKKSPVTVLAEQSVVAAMNCRVVATARSVPSPFNTVNGSENLATTWPRAKIGFI